MPKHKDETEVQLSLAMHALDMIRFATGSRPEAWHDEASWYRGQFYGCVATAAAVLRDIEDDDGHHAYQEVNHRLDVCERCGNGQRHWSHQPIDREEIDGSI